MCSPYYQALELLQIDQKHCTHTKKVFSIELRSEEIVM